jgi:hypothetical protein
MKNVKKNVHKSFKIEFIIYNLNLSIQRKLQSTTNKYDFSANSHSF